MAVNPIIPIAIYPFILGIPEGIVGKISFLLSFNAAIVSPCLLVWRDCHLKV
jgi:hypothetical protein